jgi:hypothetical protein
VAVEITMADGSQFVTPASEEAETLTKKFERRGFVAVETRDETVYINTAHVTLIRDI